MTRILVVEDDADLAMGLEDDLRNEGYTVEVARDGRTGAAMAKAGGWSLIVLDVMLPFQDGLAICRDLRRAGDRTPVILLTAKAQEGDKLLGFECGADDYVTKPFSPRELRARIRAVLWRAEGNGEERVQLGEVEIDLGNAEMRRGGVVVDLTATEFRMLQVFLKNRGRVLSREVLIEQAWGMGASVTDRAVDQHVVNLRRKLEGDPAQPVWLVSVRGLGYRLVK